MTNPTTGMHRASDIETSIQAAEKILSKLSDLKNRILRAIRRWKMRTGGGATAKEIEHLPEFQKLGYSTVRKRVTELEREGFLVRTEESRDGCKIYDPVPLTRLMTGHQETAGRLF